ncbi:hypothetical protein CPB85DRAFT_1428942 [Mucidula mucida]|nr:hypothetical protein CPB85DRAFT_1428942 [Mucidula mucida]
MPSQLDLALGGVVVSTFFSFLSMGVICACAFQYFANFPNDKWVFKALVSACMIMSTIDTISTGLWCYNWSVTNYGNPAAMAITHWGFAAEAALLLFVQCFYAWRIWMVSMKKHWWLSAIIVTLSTMAWCVVVWMTYIISTHKMVADLHLVLPVVYIWLGGSVAADVMITCCMAYYLDLRFRNNMNQRHMPSGGRFKRIIVRTVECNAISLVAQTVTVALFNRPNVGFYFVLTDMTLAKIYTFSLLVSLNGRHLDGRESTGIESSKGAAQAGESHALSERRRPPIMSAQVSIQVQ